MKEKEKTQIRVGIFVLFSILLTMFVIFMLGNEQSLFQSTYTLNAYFEDVSGLRAGAPVELAGFQVGHVDAIAFSEKDGVAKMKLELVIQKKYQSRIRVNSIATLSTQGLLGDKFVYITMGDSNGQELAEGDVINTRDVQSLLALTEEGSDILKDLKSAVSSTKEILAEIEKNREDIGESVHSVRQIIREIESGQGFLHALIYDKSGQESMKNLSESISSFQSIVNRIKNGEGTLGGLATDPSVYDKVRVIMGRIDRSHLTQSISRETLKQQEKKLEDQQ